MTEHKVNVTPDGSYTSGTSYVTNQVKNLGYPYPQYMVGGSKTRRKYNKRKSRGCMCCNKMKCMCNQYKRRKSSKRKSSKRKSSKRK